MKIGSFHIECVIEYRVMEGSRIKLRTDDLDKAIQWADDELEAEREAEERAQYGESGIGSDRADRNWKHRHEESV